MIVREHLQHATHRLKKEGCEEARLDAEVLLMAAWDISPTQLIIRALDELPEAIADAYNNMIEQRCQRMPVAYITGTKEFWSLDFKVNKDVLIPRPETEHLIEEVIRLYPNRNHAYHFAEIGTGSGCIAISLAMEYPHAQIIATDISEKALNVAQSNAQRHDVEDRIDFRQGDVYQALPESLQALDAIVSNPPYLALQHMQDIADELRYEPSFALTDKKDGLSLLREILTGASHFLKPQGYCLLETGLSGLPSTPASLSLLHEYHDLAGILRGGVYRMAQNKL